MSERVYQELLARVGESNPRPRLEPSAALSDLLGNPQDSAPVIHITGTNGKTSTARMIDSLLRATGLKTGLLTSPHLESFTERIQIDGEPISEEALERNWAEIRPLVELVDAQLLAAGDLPLTFFEVLTALAFACFADAPVDVMVIEVGMGGEWDSTNIVRSDVAVFTPIGLDHIGRIGDTLEEIASTKAGIINADSVVVSSGQDSAVADVIAARAAAIEVPVVQAPRDFSLERAQIAVGGQLLTLRGISGDVRDDVFLPLFGAHQAHNAATAIAAVEAFLGGGSVIADELLADGFAAATSPGRLEVVGVAPAIIVDGAHNPHGMAAVVTTLTDTFGEREWGVVLATLADKDATGVLRELASLQPQLFVTQSRSDRAVDSADLALQATDVGFEPITFTSSTEAIARARDWAGQSDNRAVLITGSLTLVGEAIGLAKAEGWMRP